MLAEGADRVFAQEPATVDRIIADAVRIKAEVVTADEREGDLRRILNFGHTVGHALEADTQYQRFLHGEAVAFGMHAATALAERVVELAAPDASRIHAVIRKYGPIQALTGITASSLFARLAADKKTVQGKIHFVLPVKIGDVKIVTGVDDRAVMEAIEAALAS